MSDVVADSESNSSDLTEEKNFIDKLLVEMKSQFNKTDKKQLDEDEMLTDDTEPQSVHNQSSFIKLESESIQIKSENCLKEPVVTEEMLNKELELQEHIKEEDIEMEEDLEQEEKPRIVLTFRKPASSSKTKPKPADDANLGRRSVRKKSNSGEEKQEEIGLKRSARRRSKDCGESILQSAIARKEKSYNESNKPQRLTRQLKPTPKILENLKNAALEKSKHDKKKSPKLNDKQKLTDNDSNSDLFINADENTMQNETDFGDHDRNYKKHKHKHHHNKHSKKNIKKIKSSHSETSKESDSDHSSSHEINVKESDSNPSPTESLKMPKLTKMPSVSEDKPHRRSQRISSSRYKVDESEMLDIDGIEMVEPSIADISYPSDPECSSVGAQLIASRLCLCTQKTHLYAVSEEDITYCSAVDSINEKIVGCNNVVDVNEVSMMRPSSRVPYILLCKLHRNRMLRHNCCPACGVFCTQGRFAQCEAKHQYHRDCQISVGDMECCPHCGQSTPDYDIYITMHTAKQPIFLPKQNIVAKMCFPSKTIQNLSSKSTKRHQSPPLIPSDVMGFAEDAEFSSTENCDIEEVLQTIRDGSKEKLAAILGSHIHALNSALEQCDGGTILHYAAQNGYLLAVHMLVLAKIDLDSMDKEQNTPLMLAVLSMKNEVVQYLVKVGASTTLKGTDGMTALHLAAKCGNLDACEILLSASLHIKYYINKPDDGGWTPLVWACEHGHENIAKFLMYKGADPLLRDVEHNIALHWAAFSGSTHIIELLLNHGSDVNAVNAHGDAPLHIGARQEKYNSVLVLIARGASVTLLNKEGLTALECCREPGDCFTAISLNLHMQALIESDRLSNRILLSNDISNGKESNPIQCVNVIDDESCPNDFVYVTKNCITMDIPIDYKISSLQFCKCEDKCYSETCVCTNNSFRCWYDEEGKLSSDFDYNDPPMLFECNMLCSCNTITCNNRIVQRGLSQRFQLFRTDTKGWGIRTLRNVPKGTFVCEYIGEIINDAEADSREDDGFLFDLDSKICLDLNDKETFCIDARKYGNLSRFINHSCEPNLLPIRIFIEHQDLRFPRIAFFANQDIPADEELSFDYGEKFWRIKCKSFTCNCKSTSCKYSEGTILATLENYSKRLQEENECIL